MQCFLGGKDRLSKYYLEVLGAFVKLQKASTSLVMSARLHATIRLSIDAF